VPNKTIYVKDERLWEQAKKFAGKDGLSAVIANSLAEYVAARQAATSSEKVFRLVIEPLEGPPERIAFAGQLIESRQFPSDPYDMLVVSVYKTAAGRFVVTAGFQDQADQDPAPFHYAVYDHPLDISEDLQLKHRIDPNDLISWARSLHLRHLEETTNETWIE
jgi:hypothetical protein